MVWIELIVGIGIPAFGVGAFIVKYFWNKEKCFLVMKNKINQLSAHDKAGEQEHNGYDERLNILEKDADEIKIYLRQILKKLDIPYD